eukprot:340231-Prorocentrum_minimum.AAC.2
MSRVEALWASSLNRTSPLADPWYTQVYTPGTLEERLNLATKDYCSRHVQVVPPAPGDPGAKTTVVLPARFDWYRDDFAGGATRPHPPSRILPT